MTTDVLDSTNVNSLQPLSSFDFNAKHNGVSCIASLNPDDKGTEKQFRFTASMLATIYSCKADTIRSRVETLVNTGDLSDQNFGQTKCPDSRGSLHETTLYDLTVFNKLAMTFIDNPRAVEMRKAFNDVLVKAETQAPMMCLPQDYESALEALLTKVRENKALQAERDEAVRTKYLFVEGRDAKVCGELGGLRTQNEALRKQIGDSKRYKAVSAITWITDYFDISNRGIYGSLASKLKKVEEEMGAGYEHINIPDSKYGTVKAYHIDVIERLHAMIQSDESFMAKYRKILSV